ncbi:MAG: methylated-DNA--[protein]-cysteine S-methyltransferase [Ardenticatenaceae bacterium]|nr:methylated-DNA--[protein]-cysteine S-methyltransferase [Ardenticatenaceae bacterium]
MYPEASTDYLLIEQAINYLEQNYRQQPDLQAVADYVGLSEYHFQRLFTRWVGISPKKFVQFLTLNYAKELLAESHSLLETTYEAGLSSPGRLHDLFITCEAVTPGEYKRQGEGLAIAYGFHATPFGDCLLGVTERGICGLSFVDLERREQALDALAADWPLADLARDEERTRPFIDQIFTRSPKSSPLALFLQGTNFQIQVWQALLRIGPGTAVTYSDVAQLAGNPKAVRAVGTAVGRNPIAYLIPCHRVIRQTGSFGQYQWGSARKKAILGWEAAQRYRQTQPGTLSS